MNLEQTIKFIKQAHAGQYRKSGEPYYEHPISVMNRLGPDASTELKQVALLHDVLEDTNYSSINLKNMGFSKEVVIAVMLLTKYPKDRSSYLEKIQKIADSNNELAIRVKIADNEDNSDLININRINDLNQRKKHQEMANGRYRKSLEILRKALNDQRK